MQADFLRGVTHDLQTPLTSIAALATELRAAPDQSEETRDDLDSIAHQAERLRRMVSQLLVASRLDAGVLTPQQEVFAVPPLVERTWAALRADRPFELDVTGPPHLAVADEDRLEQVLWAVLDNAVKYSPSQSPVHAGIDAQDGMLAVTIRDRGAGMDTTTREQRIRAVLSLRRRPPPGSRRERRRPLRRERPDAGDGRSDRDHERRGRGDRGDAARSGRAQRRGSRVEHCPRYRRP